MLALICSVVLSLASRATLLFRCNVMKLTLPVSSDDNVFYWFLQNERNGHTIWRVSRFLNRGLIYLKGAKGLECRHRVEAAPSLKGPKGLE
jgi:hypothetical protein